MDKENALNSLLGMSIKFKILVPWEKIFHFPPSIIRHLHTCQDNNFPRNLTYLADTADVLNMNPETSKSKDLHYCSSSVLSFYAKI